MSFLRSNSTLPSHSMSIILQPLTKLGNIVLFYPAASQTFSRTAYTKGRPSLCWHYICAHPFARGRFGNRERRDLFTNCAKQERISPSSFRAASISALLLRISMQICVTCYTRVSNVFPKIQRNWLKKRNV